MTFGEKIKKEREKLGLTQVELAEKIGVSRQVVSSYEKNRSRPRGIKAYKKVADALGLQRNYLLTEQEEFVLEAKENYGYRGKKGAEKLVAEINGLFAGGEMCEEDMDEFMFAVQEAYVIAKNNNKKYIPKRYLKKEDQD